jgi:uncharacterized protein (UPF0248 family)
MRSQLRFNDSGKVNSSSFPFHWILTYTNSDIESTIGESESHVWPEILQDPSKSGFWFIGLPSLLSRDLARCKECLRGWQRTMKNKLDEKLGSVDARFIPRKVFVEQELKIYDPTRTRIDIMDDERNESEQLGAVERDRSETGKIVPNPKNFKKIKGSNPQQVRRQFLEHTMQSTSSSSSSNTTIHSSPSPSTKLRPGKEILNRLKFDQSYDTADYAVGYIDRKAGILEKSVDELAEHGEEESMAYVRNVKDGEIVWDKVGRIDLVSRRKGS